MDYRVQVDAYNGPLDLLLFLVKRSEVDIYDIPIARITEQYMQFMELFQEMEITLAGEFMVMAATLMEIKSRMLLPTHKLEPDEEEEDPRAELVRELLAYRQFKEAGDALGDLGAQQQKKFPRPPTDIPDDARAVRPLDEISIWELLASFNKLMGETLGRLPMTITGDGISVEECMEELCRRLAAQGQLAFWQAFEPAVSRRLLVGYFLAILELCRRQQIIAQQPDPFGEIYLRLRPGDATEAAGEAQS